MYMVNVHQKLVPDHCLVFEKLKKHIYFELVTNPFSGGQISLEDLFLFLSHHLTIFGALIQKRFDIFELF